jgi:uncharacterized protein YegP (UPF0339 family)
LSIGFPDLDIRFLGIGMHRFFLFHSAIVPIALTLIVKPMAKKNAARNSLLSAFCGAFFLGIGFHLFLDGFQSKAVIFPFIGSLVAGTSLDDRLWLFCNSAICIFAAFISYRKVLAFARISHSEAEFRTSRSKVDKKSRLTKKKTARIKKAPVFEIFIDAAGEHRFRLKAPNGEVILASSGYKEKKDCMDGALAVKGYALEATIEVIED